MAKDGSEARGVLTSAYLEFREVLARLVARIVGSQDVDDILQETYIRTYVASQKTEIRHPRAFMLRTARNLALNEVTSDRRKRTRHAEEEEPSVWPTTATLESELESRERFLGFCRSVRSLPAQCRRVFVLKKVYGLSQREIAQFLGIAESTVEKHVAKGLLACMESMKAQGHSVGPSDEQAVSVQNEGSRHG